MTRRALESVRVLDLTQIFAGPYCGRLLADMGAQVIKIESARRTDGGRTDGTFSLGGEDAPPWERRATFNQRNRGKLDVTIDMTTAKGKELFLKLVRVSDVVVDNFSARVMSNWGLDYPMLRRYNPEIIMISMPASGMTGPERDYVAMGAALTPLAGLVAISGYLGDAPHSIGAYTDPVAGLNGAGAILAALHYRAETGKGQYIDLSQREAAARLIGDAIMDYTMNGRVWSPMGNRHPAYAPRGCYPCKGEDKWVTIAVRCDEEWHALCEATGHPEWVEDPRFGDALSRWHNQEQLDALISAWTVDREHREVMKLLQAHGVAAGAVHTTPEFLEDPHFVARGYFPEVHHPQVGTFPSVGVYAKLSKTPGYIASGRPLLGEHNEYIFGSVLGLSLSEREELLQEGVTATDPLMPLNTT